MNNKTPAPHDFAHDAPEAASCLYWCLFTIVALVGAGVAYMLLGWFR
jgi:hypothetical protein